MKLVNRKFVLEFDEVELRHLLNVNHQYLTSEGALNAHEDFRTYLTKEETMLEVTNLLSNLLLSDVYSKILETVSKHYNFKEEE